MTSPLCNCGCGEVVERRSYETDNQWRRREKLGIFRDKCKRNLKPLPSPKDRPTLVADPTAWNLERVEGKEQPKEHIPRSEPYLKFIKAQECILTGGKFGPCLGDIAPHHTASGGMSIKGSDFSCVPVCVPHHLLMDNAGKKGNGIWTRRELETIITRLNEEFNFQQSHKIQKGGR